MAGVRRPSHWWHVLCLLAGFLPEARYGNVRCAYGGPFWPAGGSAVTMWASYLALRGARTLEEGAEDKGTNDKCQ